MTGSILIELKKYKEAVEMYERAVKLTPRDPLLRYNLGFLYYLMKEKEPAIRELEEYLKLRGTEKDETIDKVKKMIEAMKRAK
ncbi:MAG: tetratricopeptide repeat protein [Spirochaetia bacterium]|nr:tetratricopeptide repeat protein [Spirochaetia bacterium]